MEQVADHAIVEYDLTDAQLNQLAVDYDPSNIPEAKAVGDEGYNIVHERVMAITKVRTNIERKRKELKKDALEWGRKVDTEAKRLTGIVEDLESPWRQVKLNLEEVERKAAEERLAAAQARQEEIERAIAKIKAMADGLINAGSKVIQNRIDDLESMVITEDVYGEFVEAAKVTGDIVGKALRVALAERTAFEEAQLKLEAERKADEAERAKLREEQAALKAERDLMEKQKAEQEAAERAVEAAKAKEAQRKADEIREQEEAWARQQAAAADKAYLKERLPQDIALRAFACQIEAVPCPEGIEDPDLITVLDDALDHLVNVVASIRAGTQEVD